MKPESLSDLVKVRVEFDRCWPWLWASLCEFGPTHNKEQVWFRISAGKAFLWTGKSCVILGEFIDHPIGFRSFNYWLQGGDLDELLTFHPGVEAWALSKGCNQAIGDGRKGWVRKMDGDWRTARTLRRKWLTEPPLQVKRALKYEPL